MAYEIPKNLQYTEKILFNLSFEQAAWIGIFGLLTFTTFFKLPIPIEIRVVVGILFAGLAAGFAFFDFRTYAANLVHFLRSSKQMGYLDPKMGQFLEIKSIEKDTVFLQKGGIKAIIHVHPINFHILSPRQKQAIISAYKDFLNSLDFPIQIVMRTVNLELDDYLQKLEGKVRKQKKPQLLTQFQDFQAFVKKYIEEHSVKNRQFYIIIPVTQTNQFLGTKTDPLEQLAIRVQLCQERLRNCNLLTKRLSSNELISLFSSYFDGFIEAENDYLNTLILLKKGVHA